MYKDAVEASLKLVSKNKKLAKGEIAIELANLLEGNGSHVNLIPINPTAGDFKRPPENNVEEFEQILSKAGVNCTIRIEKGTEISAACGQLRTDLAD